MRYVGAASEYQVESAEPFAYGRVSVLFRTEDSAGNALCLKLFPITLRDRRGPSEDFLREVTAQTRLRHENILPVLDSGTAKAVGKGGPFVILPFCFGGDLRRTLASRDFVPLAEALPILEGIAAGIDFAHSTGFIHGDIKPENVLFPAPGSPPRLADFGMSKYFTIKADVSTMRQDSDRGGTAAYLSPEQIEDGEQSPSSDVYSFALVAFEMLTGQLPFDLRKPQYQQMRARVEGRLVAAHDANPRVSREVSEALSRALSVDRSKRPRTATELCEMLGQPRLSDGPASPGARDESDPAVVNRTGIFVCYSHKDQRWLAQVRTHLRPLERERAVELWDDGRIQAGAEWRTSIARAIDGARVAILLISADYLASEFITTVELPRLLERAKSDGLAILQVVLSPCRFQETPVLSQFQTVNDPAHTLADMSKAEQQRTLVRLAASVWQRLVAD